MDLDEPRDDEILVRLVATGVCHTDLSGRDRWTGPPPVVFGHEGAGLVERVGQRVSRVAPGDHVVLTFLSCGACTNCVRGLPSYCLSFPTLNLACTRPDGSTSLKQADQAVFGRFFGQSSLATYALAAERNAVKVRRDVPLELLGPLGCGIQTGAGAVLNALRPRAGSSLVVFGTGSVGMIAIMAAVVAGCTTIIAVDLRPGRLALARELGATHQIAASDADIGDVIRSLTSGGADFALDTTSRPEVIRQAVDALRTTGTCGVIGAAPPGTELTLSYGSVLMGRTIRGILEGDSIPELFIPSLIDLYLQGRFPFDRLIASYPFSQINKAAAASERGDVVKPVLRMDGGR